MVKNDASTGDGQGQERTVTVTGAPLIAAGLVAFLSLRWLRRRSKRSG